MLIFIKTQSGFTAANSFMNNLCCKNDENFTISYQGKGLGSLLKIISDLKKIIKTTSKETRFITDCGCLKTLLIFLLASYNLNYSFNVYTTFYHHVIKINDINMDFSRAEIWKTLGLKFYLKLILLFNLKLFNFITVSQFSKDILIRDFSIDPSNIFVLWNQFFNNNANAIFLQLNNSNVKYKKPFILIISSFKKRKNLQLIRKIAIQYKDNLKIVFPSPKNNYELDQQLFFNKFNVEVLNDLNEEKLFKLYSSTFCVVVPSLYEGLSLVPLESISFSVPLLMSNIDAHTYWELPKSFYFDVTNFIELQSKIDFYLLNEKKIIDYSKYSLLMNKINNACKERSKNIIDIFKVKKLNYPSK